MKNKIVEIDGRKVTIAKLPLGKYSELLKAIKNLPQHFSKFKNADSDAVLAMLPELIGEGMPDFIAIMSIATPLTPEELEMIGLDDAVRLALAVIEVNNYQEVYQMAKKAMTTTPPEK